MDKSDLAFYRKYRDELRRVILTLTANPTASETISSPSGGSRSVTYASISGLQAELKRVEDLLAMASVHRGNGCSVNYVRWC